MNNDKMTVEDLLEVFRKPENSIVFKVAKPCKITHRSASNSFRKFSFVGEESMLLVNAYYGSRNSLIFQFEKLSNLDLKTHDGKLADYASGVRARKVSIKADKHGEDACIANVFELRVNEARQNLKGFPDWIEALLNADFDKTFAKIKRQTKKNLEEEKIEEMMTKTADHPHYGSW
jgi:hypothetical protein